MQTINCSACGGTVQFSEGSTVGICEYCGSKVTRSQIEDEQRDALHNRGNFLRMRGEYDRALSVFEQLIALDDTDADAHWNAALCRYGIEYVKDPETGKRIPTCHRANWDSILSDVDYLAAIHFADPMARKVYETDGKYIDEVQRNILAISRTEEPYDIFICYKETNLDGSRTKDSVLAQDIFDCLSKEGYRVFFARISLEDKLGLRYEPYIFSALNSAKVMLVIGTSADNINSPWVKNEWSRFLSLMKTNRTKVLIPCYRDMDPMDFPDELAILQSQDMGKIGFEQDLSRGINKILVQSRDSSDSHSDSRQIQSSSNALLLRAQIFLKDHEWTKATTYFERVLDLDPKCVDAYVGKTCVLLQCSDESEIEHWYRQNLSSDETDIYSAHILQPLSSYSDYKKALDFSDGQRKHELENLDNRVSALIEASKQKKKTVLQNKIDELTSQINPLIDKIKPINEMQKQNASQIKKLEEDINSEKMWQNDVQFGTVSITNGCLPIVVIWICILIILIIINNYGTRTSDQFIIGMTDLMLYVSTAGLLIFHLLRFSRKNRVYRENRENLETSIANTQKWEWEISECRIKLNELDVKHKELQPKLDELISSRASFTEILNKYN